MGLPAEKKIHSDRRDFEPPRIVEEPFYQTPSRWRGVGYYLRCKLQKRPYLVNIEFTKLCNAKCFFCHCWQVESPGELQDYSPIVKRFRPVVCSVSGGEPLLRKNFAELFAGIRPWCHYLQIITNGALLNEDTARELRRVGVNQITISLDFNSSHHDEVRKIDGLYDHISKIVPILTAKGYNIIFNTIIMESNLKEVVPLAHKAREWGAKIGYSSFCTLKANEESELVRQEKMGELKEVVAEIKHLKKKYHHITNSYYYLDHVVPYFEKGGVAGCKAGHSFIQVTPDGYIQRCAEMPRMEHFSTYWPTNVGLTECTKCWYACRGETEAPFLSPRRLPDLLRAK